jgi:alpha-amylase/alpha-mannosidase (GH57 family)
MQRQRKSHEGSGIATGRFFCIHGHFYQPPRENPWLEAIEVEDSAAPYHDWNERICAECYAPNAHARIVDRSGQVHRMINNYEWISFNVGPTLLAWMKRHGRRTLEAVLEADRKSAERCGGHGNAMAQAYNHTILPLADRKDKVLQVRWGIQVFRDCFQREPEGMWLPETAVDSETLEVLAENGIRFTVLSPRQAGRIRWKASGEWETVGSDSLDTRQAYRCRLPSGNEIALFFYDGVTAQRVAFERLLSDGEQFFKHMSSRFDPGRPEGQLVHVATDGETFGHHHRFGEMAVAYLISRLEGNGEIRLTNYGEFLSLYPPVAEVEIVENSSWSCAHGVERWRSDCGCRPSGSSAHQRWRGPLRKALNHLKGKLDAVFEREGRKLFRDPWAALEAYVQVLLDRGEEQARRYLAAVSDREWTEEEAIAALKLLEMERHGQLMFTSCAWFFDEISGIETVQTLRLAARAIQLAEKNFGVLLEEEFLGLLELAPSNHPDVRDGRQLWEREVRPAVTDLERVLAHFAVSLIFRQDPPPLVGHAYQVNRLDTSVLETGHAHFVVGSAEVVSIVTLETVRRIFAVVHFGGMDVQFFRMPYVDSADYKSFKKELTGVFQSGSMGDLYQRLLECFHGPTHQLMDLFLDEQRAIVDDILKERVEDYQVVFEQLFDQDHAMLQRLAALRVPIPEPMKMAAKVSTDGRVRESARRLTSREDLQALAQLLEQAKQWGYRMEAEEGERLFLLLLEEVVRELFKTERIAESLERAGYILEAAEALKIKLNLWNIQNLYVLACNQREAFLERHKDAVRSFASRIQLNPEALPLRLR